MGYRERILAEIKKMGEELGRAPSQKEFRSASRISWHQVHKHFGGMSSAVRAAGLQPTLRGSPLDERAMVLDWARVVRELGRLPTRAEYDARGKHTAGTLHVRVGWREMGQRFVVLVQECLIESEWEDVLEVVWKQYSWLKHLAGSNREDRFIGTSNHRVIGNPGPVSRELTRMEANQGMRLGRVVAAALAIEILLAAEAITHHGDTEARRKTEQEIKPEASGGPLDQAEARAETRVRMRGQAGIGGEYGEPLELAAMANAPTNEDGVLFLFGVLAADMGFRIERVQQGFPDVEAKREIAPGRWERQFWELELYSRHFKEHKHDSRGCHGIICWKHNWAEVPRELEVIELSKVVKGK